MIPKIHIGWGGQAWYARFDKTIVKSIAHGDKNKVVKGAIAVAELIYKQAVVVIHGLDGRVLEKREIGNEEQEQSGQ